MARSKYKSKSTGNSKIIKKKRKNVIMERLKPHNQEGVPGLIQMIDQANTKIVYLEKQYFDLDEKYKELREQYKELDEQHKGLDEQHKEIEKLNKMYLVKLELARSKCSSYKRMSELLWRCESFPQTFPV